MPNADHNLIIDSNRINTLRKLCILDTPADPAFDRLTSLATRILNVPVSTVTLVDENRQFFKSQIGLPEPYATTRETPLSHSFCQHTVVNAVPLIVDDARQHPLVFDNLSIDDLGVVAYLGIPLTLSDGTVLGSFCVIDHQPRHWTDEEVAIVIDLTAAVITEIELRGKVLELQNTERVLRQREHFISEVMINLPVLIYIYDVATQRVSYTNREIADLAGGTVNDGDYITSLFPKACIHVEDFDPLYEALHELENSKVDEATVFEYRFRFNDTVDWSWANSLNQPFLRDESGTVTQVLGIIRDVTAVKRQLEQDLKIMEEEGQIRLMSEFIRNTSHEIRTPLTSFQTNIDLIRRTTDPEKVKERLNHMQDSVQQIVKVLDQFMVVGEIYTRKSVDFRQVNIRSVIGKAIDILTTKHHMMPEFRHEESMTEMHVYGDGDQLREALYALLENAVLHTNTKTVQLEINLTTRDDLAIIEIYDNGDGIAPESLKHIFDLFYKGNEARTSNGSGAGLGLYKVKKIVNLHGGDITVKSEVGEGTTIIVSLPLSTSIGAD
ncbi:MAG: ATP-binding protein [Aggregatilineales bacterium]